MIDYSKLKLPYTKCRLNSNEIQYGINTDFGIHPIFKIVGIEDKPDYILEEIEEGLLLSFDKKARCINEEEREWEFYKYKQFDCNDMVRRV